jgi:hypothetical protein
MCMFALPRLISLMKPCVAYPLLLVAWLAVSRRDNYWPFLIIVSMWLLLCKASLPMFFPSSQAAGGTSPATPTTTIPAPMRCQWLRDFFQSNWPVLIIILLPCAYFWRHNHQPRR